QNPIEQEGTYLLSEAQLDRFFMKALLDYPTAEEEMTILNRIEQDVFSTSEAVATLEDVAYLQQLVKRVYIDDSVKKYIIDLVDATRHPQDRIYKDLAQYVTLGSSIRGGICLMEVAKAVALLNGRDYVTPDDVKSQIKSVLRHRVSLNFAAVADNVTEDQIIDAIVGATPTP
ncbi:MAG TPA: AAA family ATPase, partial [Clostridiales bacterium]|nr:AAA family ATPase [Clostridiales bacterium]